MIFQFIAATFLKLIQKSRGPSASLYFVRVVEERVRIGRLGAFKGLLDMLQIVRHGIAVEMVNHKSFAARSCTLHLHYTIFDIKSHDGLWLKRDAAG